MTSLLPKALVAVLAPYTELPKTYLEPLREIRIHNPWCSRRKQVSWDSNVKKTDEDPKAPQQAVNVTANANANAKKTVVLKFRPMTPADLV